jgi:hypothetical protein
MARRIVHLIVCSEIVPMISCNKSAAPRMAAPPPCALVSARDVKLDDGTELRTWDLRTFGLNRLTARLVVATDGKAQTAREVEYKWEPGAGSATGQLVLLIQDGKAFGAKGRFAVAGVGFPGLNTRDQDRVVVPSGRGGPSAPANNECRQRRAAAERAEHPLRPTVRTTRCRGRT